MILLQVVLFVVVTAPAWDAWDAWNATTVNAQQEEQKPDRLQYETRRRDGEGKQMFLLWSRVRILVVRINVFPMCEYTAVLVVAYSNRHLKRPPIIYPSSSIRRLNIQQYFVQKYRPSYLCKTTKRIVHPQVLRYFEVFALACDAYVSLFNKDGVRQPRRA